MIDETAALNCGYRTVSVRHRESKSPTQIRRERSRSRSLHNASCGTDDRPAPVSTCAQDPAMDEWPKSGKCGKRDLLEARLRPRETAIPLGTRWHLATPTSQRLRASLRSCEARFRRGIRGLVRAPAHSDGLRNRLVHAPRLTSIRPARKEAKELQCPAATSDWRWDKSKDVQRQLLRGHPNPMQAIPQPLEILTLS